ncbi:MBL fold metallo-hydrolase [Treponema sp. OttesenSCG-928-L16]|nr:MBL fold metallo-hydrolase [Treponema sp. OttesenSCG-928-L16]
MLDHITVGAIATNCWIIPLGEDGGPGNCVIIDPGADPAVIIARLQRRGLIPRYILLTHGHFDHIAALPGLVKFWEQEKPKTAVHSLDADHLGDRAYETHIRDFGAAGSTAYVEELWEDMPEADILLSEGDRIGPFTVLHLPGHSPGSIAFFNEQEGLLFSGDTLFRGGMGRTDLPGGDGRALGKSLERLLAMDGNIRVFPGHGPETSIGTEGPHYR